MLYVPKDLKLLLPNSACACGLPDTLYKYMYSPSRKKVHSLKSSEPIVLPTKL